MKINIKHLKILVVIAFAIKVFDSLYLRPHSDAMNYHMYAPIMWAQYGFLHFNFFQTGHYQGALFEWIMTLVFKISAPETLEQKTNIFIFVQFLSAVVGFLLIPLFLIKTFASRVSVRAVFLIVWIYYGCEYLNWSAQFAKNDIWACGAFLVGVFSPALWLQALGLGLAVGIKATYVFGVFLFLLISYFSGVKNLKQTIVCGLSFSFFFGLVLLRNFLGTGNPLYPQPSPLGAQPSSYRVEYFKHFSGLSSFAEVIEKLSLLVKYSPGVLVLFLCVVGAVIQKRIILNRANIWKFAMILLPLPTLFLTGDGLEWRTFAGVVYVSLFYAVILLDELNIFKTTWIYVVLGFAFLSTSKIDVASFRRWKTDKDKTFWEMNINGQAYKRANETLEAKDILLNLNYSEGYFLNPRMYTVDEHPDFEKIKSKYPELNDVSNFIGVHTNGLCFGSFENFNFLNKLLEKSSQDLKQDSEAPKLYHLNIEC